jgi:DNA-binding transcriptional ArsR family regulator
MSRSSARQLLAEAAPLFAALGDETRLRLLSRLSSEGPLSITRLSDGGDITRQAVTKHLHALAHAGLVRDSASGRERIWELEPRRLEKARRYLARISEEWDEALGRLRELVEREP